MFKSSQSAFIVFLTFALIFVHSAAHSALFKRNLNECRVILQTRTETLLFSNQDQKQIHTLINDLYNQKNASLVYTLLATDFLFVLHRKNCGDRRKINISTQITTTDYVDEHATQPFIYYYPKHFPRVQLSCPAKIKICSKNPKAIDFILKKIEEIGLRLVRKDMIK